jgi:basic amino acid/polyamine antiporter, APA family
VATVGLFFMTADNFGPFNVSGDNWFGAISSAGVVVLFAFLGVEAASIAAGRVRNPDRNVPRATIIGTLASALVYVLCTVAIFGVVGPKALAESTAVGAPFVDTFAVILGSSNFGWAVALVAVISGIGALNGWTMICAEMPYAAARDKVFPKAFAWTTRQSVPWFAIVSGAALASAAAIFSYSGEGGLNAFLTLVYLTGVTAAIPYFFSALAQVYFLFTDPRRVSPGRLVLDTFVAIMAGLFSLWFVYGSGSDATYWAFLMILAGFAVYAVMKIIDRRHSHGPGPSQLVPATPEPIGEAVSR